MEDCGLTQVMLSLPYQFLIPDILFYEELEESHPELLEQGLTPLELSSESMIKAQELGSIYINPSRNDCIALAASIQEECTLLTGDRALRNAAKKEGVEIKGTIWVIEELIQHQFIDKQMAVAAFETMKAAGSRLPWDKAEKMLNQF